MPPVLNNDVLEIIFQYLDFRSLCSAEMTCRQWKEVINSRRLYWQLSKRLSALAVPKILGEASKVEAKHLEVEQALERERKRLRRFKCKPVKRFKTNT